MKKIGASLYFAMLILLVVLIFTIIPNFQELWQDSSFWLFVGCVILVAGASIYTTRKQRTP
jgi:predicted membrane channel-forming protein YqfA (hemolysin III family)